MDLEDHKKTCVILKQYNAYQMHQMVKGVAIHLDNVLMILVNKLINHVSVEMEHLRLIGANRKKNSVYQMQNQEKDVELQVDIVIIIQKH